MARQRKLTILILGDPKGGVAAMSATGKATRGLDGILKKFGLNLKLGLGIAVVAGITALAKLGAAMDDVRDTIRTDTGAVGDELDGLIEDFKEVARTTPASLEDVSRAIADLHTRTGQVGPGLQDLARRMLELARLTKTEVKPLIAATTRLFGDWSIATGDQAETLDKLFRSAQDSGAGIDFLASSVVQFGAPLRQLGFTLEESIAMFARFEKEGVNTETVMAGLRQGVAFLARTGEDIPIAFDKVIQSIKDAGTASEANVIAIKIFGARAGPDMAAAIQEGRFELEDYLDVIQNGEDTILKAAEDTRDWRQSLQELKNTIAIALEPVATKVFGSIGNIFEEIAPLIEPVVQAVGEGLGAAFELLVVALDIALPILEGLVPILIAIVDMIVLAVDAVKWLSQGIDWSAQVWGVLGEAIEKTTDRQQLLIDVLDILASDGIPATTEELARLKDEFGFTQEEIDDANTAIEEAAIAHKVLAVQTFGASEAGRELGEVMGDLAEDAENLAPAIELTAEEEIALIRAAKDAHDALEDQQEPTEDLAEDMDNLAQRLNDAEAAQESLSGVMRAAADPVFAAVRAVKAMDDAEQRLNEVLEDSESTLEDVAEAELNYALATLEAQAALDVLATSPEKVEDAIHALQLATGKTRDEVITLLDTLGILDGKRIRAILQVSAPVIHYQQRGATLQPTHGGRILMEHGGIGLARPGRGIAADIAEGRDDEAIIPLNERGMSFLIEALSRALGTIAPPGGIPSVEPPREITIVLEMEGTELARQFVGPLVDMIRLKTGIAR